MLVGRTALNSFVSFSSAGTTTDTPPPALPPPEAQPVETKAPEEEMDVTDDDITAGKSTNFFLSRENRIKVRTLLWYSLFFWFFLPISGVNNRNCRAATWLVVV